jgi:AcrR family transcriptional regulator
MSTEVESGHTARTGRGAPTRPTLSRERIVETAIDFVDRRGLAALTMRRLGEELGVEAMSLYRYVNGREDLLEGIVDRMVAQLHLRAGHAQPRPTDGIRTRSRPRSPACCWPRLHLHYPQTRPGGLSHAGVQHPGLRRVPGASS